MGPGLLAGQLRPRTEGWLTIAERRLPAPRGPGGCLQSGSELHAVRYPVLDRGAAAFRSGWFSGRDEPQLVAIGGAKIAPAVAEQPQFFLLSTWVLAFATESRNELVAWAFQPS